MRRIKAMGILTDFLQKGRLFAALRPFFYLPFVPTDQIHRCYKACMKNLSMFLNFYLNLIILADSFPEHSEFGRYVGRNWVGLRTRRGQGTPRYPHDLWNVRDLILANQPSTNCAIERFHQDFKHNLGKTHPSVSFFI